MQRGYHSPDGSDDGVGSVIEANLNQLLRQRQEMSDVGSPAPYVGAHPRGAFSFLEDPPTEVLREESRYVTENFTTRNTFSPSGRDPFTPDRPTKPRDDPSYRRSSVGPVTYGEAPVGEFFSSHDRDGGGRYHSPPSAARNGAGTTPQNRSGHYDAVNTSRYSAAHPHMSEGLYVRQHQQQRWENERYDATRRTNELIQALDEARQSALQKEREAQTVRTELLDCEDQRSRLQCEHELLVSCYERDRKYFVAFAKSMLTTTEESGRRELVSKEAEWRSFLILAEKSDATALRQRGRAPTPSSTCTHRVDSPPRPPSDGTSTAGDARTRSPHRSPPEENKEAALGTSFGRGVRSLSESLNVSPRSHRTPSAQLRPPLSPKPEEPLPVPSASAASSGRVMHCKATLLSEVSSAKHRLEEEVAELRTELQSFRTEAARREKDLLSQIRTLEDTLVEEQALTTDMQEEIDDLIVSELLAQEEVARATLAETASDELIELTQHLLTRYSRAFNERQASYDASREAVGSGTSAQHHTPRFSMEKSCSTRLLRSEDTDEPGANSFVTLPSEAFRQRTNLRLHQETVEDVCAGSTGEVESPLSGGAARRMDSNAGAGAANGKEVLRQLLAGKPLHHPVSEASLDKEPSTPQLGDVNSLLQKTLSDLKSIQRTQRHHRSQKEHCLPPLSPTASGGHHGGSPPTSVQSEVLEILTPVTASFDVPATDRGASAFSFHSGDRGTSAVKAGSGSTERDGSASQQMSTASQGVSPEQPMGHSPVQADPQRATSAVTNASSPHVRGLPQYTQPPSPLYSPSSTAAGKQVRFEMPHFPSPSSETTHTTTSGNSGHRRDDGAETSPTPRSPGGQAAMEGESGTFDWAAATTGSSSGCYSRPSLRVPGEDLFQPQGLSFPSLSTHAWDLVDSDDESIPSPPAAHSVSRLGNDTSATRQPPQQPAGKVKVARNERWNPYDDDA